MIEDKINKLIQFLSYDIFDVGKKYYTVVCFNGEAVSEIKCNGRITPENLRNHLLRKFDIPILLVKEEKYS